MFKSKKNIVIKILDFNSIEKSPNKNEIKELNKNKLMSMEYGKNILEFSKKLLDLKGVDFSYFYRNIETLKTQNVGSLIDKNVRAGYSVRQNLIVFKDYFLNHEIDHELLHLSSSLFDKERLIEFCGFSQYNCRTNLKVGTCLNEGYTEYLNEKLFNNNSNTYILEKNISKIIEQIIGNIEMERLYFKADLKNLIIRLSKYSNMEKTMEFIQNSDYISANSSELFSKKEADKKFKNILKSCVDYLIYTYTSKLKEDIQNGVINEDEYNLNLEKFINELGSFNYYSDGKIYPMRFINEKEILKTLKAIKKRGI